MSGPHIKTISMHLHSFSLRFRLRHDPEFDVFAFIDTAAAEGFTGVNISANGPGYRDLGGTTPEHFARVGEHLAERGMRCEIDTSDTRPDNMRTLLHVAAAVGADRLRTYTRYEGGLAELIEWTIDDLRVIAPLAADLDITVVLENHEDFQGAVITHILERVAHPNVRALYDYGNSQMVGEDPLDALGAMLPFVTTVHMKDHVIVTDELGTIVQGVPMGQGSLPIIEQTQRLYDGGQRRFCFENVWAYVAPITVAVADLPLAASFVRDGARRRLDGRLLDAASAIEGEWVAFRSAWDWLRNELTATNFRIDRE